MARRLRVLTQSEMRAWRLCQRRHWWRYQEGYEPVVREAPLVFGTWFHNGLEAYWRARKARVRDPGAVMMATLPGDADPYETARLRVMFMAYRAVWDGTAARVLEVEKKFRVPLVDPATGEVSTYFELEGKIDLLLEARDGRVVLLDHKTTSDDPSEGSNYRRRLQLDEQISVYRVGVRGLGYRLDQMLWDVVRKPESKPLRATPEEDRHWVAVRAPRPDGTPRRRKGEDDAAFLERMRAEGRADVVAWLETPPTQRLAARQRLADETPAEYERRIGEAVLADLDAHVARIPLHRFAADDARADASTWAQAELMRHALAHGHAPRNSDACFAYHRPCPYLDACEGRRATLDDPARFARLTDPHPELVDEFREPAPSAVSSNGAEVGDAG